MTAITKPAVTLIERLSQFLFTSFYCVIRAEGLLRTKRLWPSTSGFVYLTEWACEIFRMALWRITQRKTKAWSADMALQSEMNYHASVAARSSHKCVKDLASRQVFRRPNPALFLFAIRLTSNSGGASHKQCRARYIHSISVEPLGLLIASVMGLENLIGSSGLESHFHTVCLRLFR